jgi:hypothetical protein
LSTGGFNNNGSRSQDNLITFDVQSEFALGPTAKSIVTADLGCCPGSSDHDSQLFRRVLPCGRGPESQLSPKPAGQQFHGSAYEYLRKLSAGRQTLGQINRTGNSHPVFKSFYQFG